MPIQFKELPIPGALEIIPHFFEDARGSFATIYDVAEFAGKGLVTDWVNDNQSYNVQAGTFRGFHFQRAPHAQTKLVRAVVGRIVDLIVDIREDSPTYLKLLSVELDSASANMLYIPKGCAHAYYTLTDGAIVGYKTDAYYAPNSEGGLRWNDPAIGFVWPLGDPPVISDRDRSWPLVGGG